MSTHVYFMVIEGDALPRNRRRHNVSTERKNARFLNPDVGMMTADRGLIRDP